MFCLLVDDFGVEYVGKRHAIHLKQALSKHCELTKNWKVDLYSGINMEWNYNPLYVNLTVRLTMDNYIANLIVKYDHPDPRKPQHSPYKHAPIIYGAKVQYSAKDDNSPPIDDDGILCVQSIFGALLLYGWAINNNLLISLSKLEQHQASATQATNDAILHILDYAVTYPRDGITFRARKMMLSSHSDASYLNVTKARSRAVSHIMLSENVPVPAYNRSILAIAQIILNFMLSAVESELAGLFICSKEMVPLRQALNKMGWPQPKSPIQCDNSTDVGVANQTIISQKTKSMDMQFHCLR